MHDQALTVLGLETSCDDTAAAVLYQENACQTARILSNTVMGQTELHAAFGGVVPEIAARAHAEKIDLAVEAALSEAGKTLSQIDMVAVTAGPGLVGALFAGLMCAKGIAAGRAIPLVGVNHLAGHALTPRLVGTPSFPYLMLLVSGGHCQFLIVEDHDRFERLGGSIDDAPGEAFDKVARLLGLAQPGGPAVERIALQARDPGRFSLPRPLLDRPGCDMSFSGLKTAVLRTRDAALDAQGHLPAAAQADLAAVFQEAVRDILVHKTGNALEIYAARAPQTPSLAVAGGVAANRMLRAGLQSLCEERNIAFTAPPLALCTDNAAMIAYAGLLRFRAGYQDGMALAARPRWPLDQARAGLLGGGKKGPKA